jgi:hypothetical protein
MDDYTSIGKKLRKILLSAFWQDDYLNCEFTIRHMHSKQVLSLVAPLPPLAEQQEIVRCVEALFKTADELEARYRKAKAHIDKLTQSILGKAFRGDLVPQDPNDEPAAALLDRLRCDCPELTTSRERIKVRPHKAITAQKSFRKEKAKCRILKTFLMTHWRIGRS